ncbi:MAG: hypothetical protein ABIR68_03050 [Ilumatobacteraceae bacterium]
MSTARATETAEREVDSFGISLPDHWFLLPLHRPDFDRTVDGLRRSWNEVGMNRTEQRRCELLLQRVRSQLREQGVVFAAASFERGFRPGVEEIDENAEVLMATCTFSVLSREELGFDMRLSIPILYSAFNTRPHPTNELATITDLEPPEICHLTAGRAVRLRRLYTSTKVHKRLERWFAETYVIPLGTAQRLAGILQFSTTNVSMAADFSTLFAGFAQTMTLFGPDDPTQMNRDGNEPASGTWTELETRS